MRNTKRQLCPWQYVLEKPEAGRRGEARLVRKEGALWGHGPAVGGRAGCAPVLPLKLRFKAVPVGGRSFPGR